MKNDISVKCIKSPAVVKYQQGLHGDHVQLPCQISIRKIIMYTSAVLKMYIKRLYTSMSLYSCTNNNDDNEMSAVCPVSSVFIRPSKTGHVNMTTNGGAENYLSTSDKMIWNLVYMCIAIMYIAIDNKNRLARSKVKVTLQGQMW